MQAPFYVATRMVSRFAESSPLFVFLIAPTPDAYARAAVRWIGHGPPLCTPKLSHQVLWCLAAVVPDCVHDWFHLREHRRHRELRQRHTRSSAAARPADAAPGVPTVK